MEILGTLIALVIVGYFLFGFKHDGVIARLEHQKLKDLTVNDLGTIFFGIALVALFIKLVSDLLM